MAQLFYDDQFRENHAEADEGQSVSCEHVGRLQEFGKYVHLWRREQMS
jgi:hypothetical protein